MGTSIEAVVSTVMNIRVSEKREFFDLLNNL
jgi:hypothetical protein